MTYQDFLREWDSGISEIMCQTSGSTGTPSNIFLPRIQMVRSAERTNSFFDISPSDTLYSCISPEYIGGKMMMVRSLVANCGFSFEEPSNHPFTSQSRNNDKSYKLVSVVPSQMISILDRLDIIPYVGNFLIGGAAIPKELRNRIIESGISAFESYGMTETSSHIALRKINMDNKWFVTLPGISVFYHSGSLLGIEIAGWKKFYTNDIAEIESQSTFRIIGRNDNIINSGGKKISPEELEDILQTVFSFPFYISSAPDEKWGEKVIFVTTDASIPPEKIIARCKDILPHFKCPKEVRYVESIPLTPNGKIKRKLEKLE